MAIIVSTADPSWQIQLRQRQALLWIGPGLIENAGRSAHSEIIQPLVRRTWRAIYCDIPAPCDSNVESMLCPDPDLTLRLFVDDAGPEQLPPNRLPVYWLRGRKGSAGPGSTEDPVATFTRMTMLSRAPAGNEVFVLGVSNEQDIAGVIEAVRFKDSFRKLVIVSPKDLNLEHLESVSTRLIHWKTEYSTFKGLVEDAANREAAAGGLTLLVRGRNGRTEVDYSPCVDPSHPITSSFDFISSAEIHQERVPSTEEVKSFLRDSSSGWLPYAAGVPVPRHREYEINLLKYLKRFDHEGASLTCTFWLPAEDGGGATTALRQLAFSVAREGFPLMIARPGLTSLDFMQLSVFLAKAVARLSNEELAQADTPWVIAFDAEHTQLLWESLRGLANGLKNRMRSVVILAVQTVSADGSGLIDPAQGTNRKVGDVLESSVSLEEGLIIGEHLSKFLPSAATRSENEWRRFIVDAARPGIEGSKSLFWVALHFWLLRLPGADESLRSWLTNKFASAVAGNPDRSKALLEIAVLGKHRLPTPVSLLDDSGAHSLATDAAALSGPLGLRRIFDRGIAAYSYAHPLVAEELLRIAESDDNALQSVGMGACLNLLDLELHILGRLLSRASAGNTACLPIVEELVTSALRVDPRESPRNYQVRDQVVSILERASPSVWDASQVFNHHVAKARRHLAMDPPDNRWTTEMRREQLSLAEEHLNDALYNIRPPDDSHRESELNLCVSMALTMDARCRIEEAEGDVELGNRYKTRAEEFYLKAQRLDADNSYVLENFARHKLRVARSLPQSEDRVRLIIEAISLLELERLSDDTGHREYATIEELANAFALLSEGEPGEQLGKLAARGSEPALVALAKLELRRSLEDPEREAYYLSQAEMLLLRIPSGKRSWRSTLPLYQIVSRRSPLEFLRRLELLDELEATGAFAWPQQLRLEYGILLFQAGDARGRREGAEVYKAIREEMASRSSGLRVPRELKFLRDPRREFSVPLKTFIVVKTSSNVGRTSFGVPDGWGTVEIAFRPYMFPRDRISSRDELDCLIQFTNFGPLAVPLTEEDHGDG